MLYWVQCHSPIIPIFYYSNIPVFDSNFADTNHGYGHGVLKGRGDRGEEKVY